MSLDAHGPTQLCVRAAAGAAGARGCAARDGHPPDPARGMRRSAAAAATRTVTGYGRSARRTRGP
eukprot:6218845-Prymnesium_polylepis.1